ncbi:YjiK family protein [Pseudomaricurvus hydrocarbonicus]
MASYNRFQLDTLTVNQKSLILLISVAFTAAAWLSMAWWQEAVNKASSQTPSVGLGGYSLVGPPVELTQMSYNASGITYSPETDSLFAIANNPTYIVELNKQGSELRKIPLHGYDDTEGLVFLGGGRFAILEEDTRSVVLVDIDPSTESLSREHGKIVSFPITYKRNKGFEGVAFNPQDQSLFVVNERQPRALYHIQGAVNPEAVNFSISSPWSLEENSLNKSDLSGLHFDQRTGHLLILSDESKSLTEANLNGEWVSRLSLSSSKAGFERGVPQAEGVTMDDDGMLYILSEPNLLYRLAPPSAPVRAQGT